MIRTLLVTNAVLVSCAPAARQVVPVLPPGMEATDQPVSQPAPLASPIVVRLEVPLEAALQRTVAAFAAEGLEVMQVDAQANRVVSKAVPGDSVPAQPRFEHVFQATISTADEGTRVLLSVLARTRGGSPQLAELRECDRAGFPDSPLFERCERDMALLQARLDRLARRIHEAPSRR